MNPLGSRGRQATPLAAISRLFTTFCLTLLFGCSPSAPATEVDRAVVVSVIDGDTVELNIGGQSERVRLLGIDAPESVHPTLPVQCFGPDASRLLAELLPPGTTVVPVRDVQARDRYGRLLLHLFREDGLHVNRWLLEQGLADVAVYQPNEAYAAELGQVRWLAATNGVGLWGSCDGPDQPLDPPAGR